MTNSPFQSQPNLTERQQRTLALASVFQSAQLAHFIAYGEAVYSSSHIAYPFLLHSIQASLNIPTTKIEHQNPLLYFQQLSNVSLGLQALEHAISQPFSPTPKSGLPKINQASFPMTYALGLMQLAKKIYRNPQHQQRIIQSQQHIIRQLSFFDYDYAHPSLMGNLAQCYKDTASNLNPRILVKGRADILQSTAHADRIRAVLMTGLQAAHLWREMGGSSLQFAFGKGKILMDIRALLKLNYTQQNFMIRD